MRGQAFDGIDEAAQETLIGLLVRVKGNLLAAPNGGGEAQTPREEGGHG